MKYRKMGKYGIKLSEVSLGAWLTYGGSVEEENAIKCIHEALEQKINFIDIADIYAKGKAEEVVGHAFQEEQFTRKNFVLSSKVFWPMSQNVNDVGLSRKHIMESIEESLGRLGADYIDLYFCHRYDYQTPLRETISTMDDLVSSGDILYWGTSQWTAAQLERAIGICKEIGAKLPAVEQPRYNMIDRYIEKEIMGTMDYNGIGCVVWSPLAQGILTGKYNDGKIPAGSRASDEKTAQFMQRELNEKIFAKVRKLEEIASSLDTTTSILALAWALRRSEVTSVITGATKPEHVKENIKASDLKLDQETLTKIEDILDNKPRYHPTYEPILHDR